MAKKNKQNTIRIISNNIYMLRFVAKFTPGLIVWTILSSILSGMVGIINTVYIAKYVLDGLQNNISFSQMLPFLSGALLLNLILALLSGLYSGWYFPSRKERLYGKMHEELFERAKEMELACYDNPKFYNDFVWAMSQADEKALTVLDSVGRFLEFFNMASGAAAIIASINTIGLYVAVFGLVVDWFFETKNNKMYYELADI